jgi:hypothetical protein
VKAELNNGTVEVTTTTGEEVASFNRREALFVAKEIVSALDQSEEEEEQDNETMSFPVDTLPTDMSEQRLKATLFDFLKQNPGTEIYEILEDGFGYTAEDAKNHQYQAVYKKLFFSELFASERDGVHMAYRVANQ